MAREARLKEQRKKEAEAARQKERRRQKEATQKEAPRQICDTDTISVCTNKMKEYIKTNKNCKYLDQVDKNTVDEKIDDVCGTFESTNPDQCKSIVSKDAYAYFNDNKQKWKDECKQKTKKVQPQPTQNNCVQCNKTIYDWVDQNIKYCDMSKDDAISAFVDQKGGSCLECFIQIPENEFHEKCNKA